MNIRVRIVGRRRRIRDGGRIRGVNCRWTGICDEWEGGEGRKEGRKGWLLEWNGLRDAGSRADGGKWVVVGYGMRAEG